MFSPDTMLLCSIASQNNSIVEQNVVKALRHWLSNQIYLYPKHNERSFTTRTECGNLSPEYEDDTEIRGSRLLYDDGRITLE